MNSSIMELAIVMAAALAPMFLLAGNLSDGDEIVKAVMGAGGATMIVTVYRLWLSRGTK